MRGLCRLTAGFLYLACASTLVLPSDDQADALQRAIHDELATDQAEPVPADDVSIELEAIDVPELDPHNDEDDDEDRVLTWLEDVDTPSTSTGSILTASLFPSATLSSAIEFVTLTPQDVPTPIDIVPSATSDHVPASPQSTPPQWSHPGHIPQQPMGLAETWRLAKSKAQSVVAIIASHITECPTQKHVASEAHISTSTISARSIEVTPTPVSKVVVVDDGYSSVVVDAEPAFTGHSTETNSGPTTASIIDVLPTAHWAEASPAHFTGPSGTVPTPIRTTSSSPLPTVTSAPASAEQQSGPQEFAQDISQPDSVPLPSTDVDPRYIIAIVVPMITIVFLSCTIFLILYLRNPRRRAEHLARYEERKTRRLYRRAACEYKLQTWRQSMLSSPPLSWFIRQPAEDLAEKGLLEPKQSGTVVATTVTQEIQSFREAHDFVDNLIQAEAGGWSRADRRRTYMWIFGGRARRQRAMSNASSDLSDGEKSAPPPYEERENYEKIEPGHFACAGREDAQDSDKSSVSSMIPTSTRHSLQTFSIGDPDSDKE